MTIVTTLDGQPINVQGNIALTTVGIPPVPGDIDDSFEQGVGFNKRVLGVGEMGDEYVTWGDNGTNYYSAYKGVSSINSNKVYPFFRIKKDTLLPDLNSITGGNLNAVHASYPFAIGGNYVYCVGAFTEYAGNQAKHLVRLNKDDLTFSLGNTGVGFASTATVQIFYANSKVFTARYSATTYNGGISTRLQVFNEDLTIDDTLTNFFIPDGNITYIFEQADGKVVMSGNFTTIGGTTQNRIVRYNTDWTVDTTFTTNVGTGPSAGAAAIKQLSDGKLVLGGSFTTFNGTASQRIIILNTDGTISTAVASGFTTGSVNTLAIDGSDNIYCGGIFTVYAGNTRGYVCKLSSTLVFDSSYNANITTGQVYSILFDSSKLYVACSNLTNVNGVTGTRFFITDTGGAVTNTINTNSDIRFLDMSGNYFYLYGGPNFTQYLGIRSTDGEMTQFVSFLNKTGTLTKNLDKFYRASGTFNVLNYLVEGSSLYVSLTANDGYGLYTPRGVVKFDNKVLDKTFLSAITAQVSSMIYDNGLIVVGTFTSPKNRIVKLDATGGVDATFDVGTGFNDAVYRITKLSNGNYLVTGNFTTYKGVTTNRICILDNLGNKVTSFVEGSGLNSLPSSKSLELSNGNYLIYGGLTTYKGVACNRAIILDSTGNQVSRLSDNVNSTILKAIEHDGKIYMTGLFSTFGVTTVNKILCIDLSTGTMVDIFGTGLDGMGGATSGNNMLIDSEGRLVVVGSFTLYNGNSVGHIVRIHI